MAPHLNAVQRFGTSHLRLSVETYLDLPTPYRMRLLSVLLCTGQGLPLEQVAGFLQKALKYEKFGPARLLLTSLGQRNWREREEGAIGAVGTGAKRQRVLPSKEEEEKGSEPKTLSKEEEKEGPTPQALDEFLSEASAVKSLMNKNPSLWIQRAKAVVTRAFGMGSGGKWRCHGSFKRPCDL